MKTGLDLAQLGQQIMEAQRSKKDYIAPSGSISMETVDVTTLGAEDKEIIETVPVLRVPVNGHSETFTTNKVADDQIAAKLQIPVAYYQRMKTHQPVLLADNVNTWLRDKPEQKHMIRTIGGNVRAVLSDKYFRIDNYDVMQYLMPDILSNMEALDVVSSQITDKRLYLKLVNNKMEAAVKVGDVVRGGVVIKTSETGHGYYSIDPFIERLVCTNGMIVPEYGDKRRHVGRRMKEDELTDDLFSDATKNQDLLTVLMKMRDIFRAAIVDATKFEKIIEVYKEKAGIHIERDAQEVIDITAKHISLTEIEKQSTYDHYIRANDNSVWGLANAVTRMAEDVKDYDRATEIEAMGWDVLKMPVSNFKIR